MNPDCCVIIEGEFELILCYGGAKPTNFHLDSIIHAVNEEIIEWLEQRERRHARNLRSQSPSVLTPIK
jgi:hypothetical protein